MLVNRSNFRVVPGGKPEDVIASKAKQSPATGNSEIATPFGLAMTPDSDQARNVARKGESNKSPIAQYLSEKSPLSPEGLSPEEKAQVQRRDAILQMFLSFGSALKGEDPKWVKNPKA